MGLGPVVVRSMVALLAILGMELLGSVVVVRLELMVGSIMVMELGPVVGMGAVLVVGLGWPGLGSRLGTRLEQLGMESRQLYSTRTSVNRHTQRLYRPRFISSRLALQQW